MKKLTIYLLISAFVALTSLADETSDVSREAPVGKSYVYKTSAGKERRMEIFFPPGHDPKKDRVPGMILFHGGGWRAGTSAAFRVAAAYFASRGIVCASAEYQMLDDAGRALLEPGESFKRVCVLDAKSAIRWFKHNAELGVDPARVITGGGSAGGHISAIATMNPSLADPTDPVASDVTVAAYVWFNPAFSPDDHRDTAVDVLTHLNAALPPTIVFFGDQDHWKVGWDAAHAKWKALGVDTIELRIAPDQKHAFFNKEPWRSVTLRATDAFLVKHGLLNGEPTMPMPKRGAALQAAP